LFTLWAAKVSAADQADYFVFSVFFARGLYAAEAAVFVYFVFSVYFAQGFFGRRTSGSVFSVFSVYFVSVFEA